MVYAGGSGGCGCAIGLKNVKENLICEGFDGAFGAENGL